MFCAFYLFKISFLNYFIPMYGKHLKILQSITYKKVINKPCLGDSFNFWFHLIT